MRRMWPHYLLFTIVMALIVVTNWQYVAHARVDGSVVANYGMNENRGDRLRDSSGYQQHGHIGRRVGLSGEFHRYPKTAHNSPERDGHIDTVPDSPLLDFGNDPFSVTVRFMWLGKHDRNLIQKGQGSPAGGMFKMKTSVGTEPDGVIKCLFRGSGGDSQVDSRTTRRLDDSRWHTVTCKRTSGGTVMVVDNKVVDRNGKNPGSISNNWPVAIGGNSYCEDTASEQNVCNYWYGRIGSVKIWRAP